MSRKSVLILVALILFSSVALTAQTRVTKPNDFTIELGGKCLLYSLGYQRTINKYFGIEASLSYFGAGTGDGSVGVFFIGGGPRFYFIPKDASPYISGGLVWVSAGTDAGPFEGGNSGVYFYASPGFEYRMSGGFLFRGGVYFLIRGSGFFVWPGITLGIAF